MLVPTLLTLTLLRGSPLDSGSEVVARAIASSYEANYAKLGRSVSIRFRHSTGVAPNLDAAIQGRWTKRFDGQGVYLSDGKNGKFEETFDPAKLRRDMKLLTANSFSSTLSSRRGLTDGNFSLSDEISPTISTMPGSSSEIVHTAQINTGTKRFAELISLPLGLGNPGMDSITRQIDMVQRGEYEAKIEKAEIRSKPNKGEADIIVVNRGGRNHYVVDLEHGSIPTRTETQNGSGKANRIWCILDDIRQVHKDAWFPYKLLWYYEGGRAIEVVIETADFEAHLSSDDFSLTFEEPESIRDFGTNMAYPPQKVWNLLKLPGKGSKGTYSFEPPSKNAPLAPIMPGERAPSRFGMIAFAILGVAFLASASAIYWKRRHAA